MALTLAFIAGGALFGCGLILDIDDRERRPVVVSVDAGDVFVPVPVAVDAGGCPEGKKVCGGVCVSKKDPDFGCGATDCTPCSLLHAATLACSDDGACQAATCKKGWAACGAPEAGCSYDLTSPTSCGDCLKNCLDGKVCDKGSCSDSCSAGTTNCNGACIDLATNANNCGQCGKKCDGAPNGDPACSAGTCTVDCRASYDHCAGNPLTCELKPLYYRDADRDGWGDPAAAPTRLCAGGAGLASTAGDCNDGDARVFPGQRELFADPYKHPTTGALTYDYNCDGVELDATGTPHFGGCGVDCKGFGFGPANSGRTGPGVNDYCGSKNRFSCAAGVAPANVRPLASPPAMPECATSVGTVDPNRCQ